MSAADKPTPEKSVQDFLQRWSRRKLGITDPDDRDEAPAPPPQAGEEEPEQQADAPSEAAPAFDLKSLPPLESIDAATDIRAFLAPGVPVELTRAALRRAWTSDPAIRDFVGIAENQWDFTDPNSVPGFGALEFGKEVRDMVAHLFGETPAEANQNPAVSSDTTITEATEQADAAATEPDMPALASSATENLSASPPYPPCDAVNNAAPHNGPAVAESEVVLRKHGGALPK